MFKRLIFFIFLAVGILAGHSIAGGLFPARPLPWAQSALMFVILYFGPTTVSVLGGSLLAVVGEGILILPVGTLAWPFLGTICIIWIFGHFVEIKIAAKATGLVGWIGLASIFLLFNFIFLVLHRIVAWFSGAGMNMRYSVDNFTGPGSAFFVSLFVFGSVIILYKYVIKPIVYNTTNDVSKTFSH